MPVCKNRSFPDKLSIHVRIIARKAKRLRRGRSVCFVAGVCSGLAYQLECPLWVMRIIWFFLILLAPQLFVPLYVLLWAVVPEYKTEPSNFTEVIDTDPL